MKNIKTRPAFFALPRRSSSVHSVFLSPALLTTRFFVHRRASSSPLFICGPNGSHEKGKRGERAFFLVGEEIKKRAALFYFDATLMTASICC